MLAQCGDCRRSGVSASNRETSAMHLFATNFAAVDWVIVAVYLAGACVIGVVVNKYIHNVSDYMVGGRGSGTALNTATYIGTGLGLVTIMYASIDGFNLGFSYMVLGLIGTAVGLTLGSTGFVIRRLREQKLLTIPEYFQVRYGRNVRVTAGAICALMGILNMGLFPRMGATFITYATGLGRTEQAAVAEQTAQRPEAASDGASPSEADDAKAHDLAKKGRLTRQQMTVNIVTSVLIALVLLYTVLGGMVSVIVTDYLQFIILAVGLGLGLYFCLFGRADLGWGNMVAALSEHRGARAFNPFHRDSYTWVWVLWMIIHFAAAALCWAPEATRALTARDPRTTKRTFLFGAPGQYIRLAIPVLFAIAAFCLVSQSIELSRHFFPNGLGGDPKHADQAMPLILGKIVPTGLLGILVAGLMAAFMSTHDSYFLCWSSVITRDVIAPLRGRELSDKQQIRITRVTILCIGVFLLVWGVWFELPESVWTYMAVTGSVWLCGAIVVLVGGMYWRGASNVGAIAALLGGFLSFAFIFDQVTAEVTRVVGPVLPSVVTNRYALLGVVGLVNYAFCAVLFVTFSLLFPNKPAQET